MKPQNWLPKLSSVFLMIVITFSMMQPGPLDAAFAQGASDDDVVYNPLTGALAFVGTQPGAAAASPLANPAADTPATNATAFVSTYGKRLGLNNVTADLILARTITDANGRSTVRYQQRYQGISVFAGEVIVNTDAHGAMLSLTAKTSPDLNVDIVPALTADEAATIAIQAISKYSEVRPGMFTTGVANLQIYDSRLLNPDGVAPRLVWNVTVSNLDAGINELVLVDAHTGAIALHYNQLDLVDALADTSAPVALAGSRPEVLGSPQIGVYTLNHATPLPNETSSWPGTFICDQDNKTDCDDTSVDDVDATNAYLNALDAYNFMKNYLKIDSFDNAGLPVRASIHYGTGNKKNSWIAGLHIASYGDGYTGADDMAGHAIGFGLLEYSGASALALAYQPGAIAESLSDMWGEFIDQTNGRGTDTTAVKWLIGEDWPDGAQRSMSAPAAAPYSDADKMTSPNYYLGTDNSIGIYTNAGVNNKAVYLMTDGGTFNGKTVTGLGITKVARIYYEVESHLLASASTYFDLYYAVKQACYNLVATSTGINAQDCDQVRNALDAVQMNSTKSVVLYPVAKFCPTGTSKGSSTLFSESFENGLAKWKMSNGSGASNLWVVASEKATNGHFHLEGPEPANVSKAVAEMASAVSIPSGHNVYLFFEHWFNFEAVGTTYHDGGVLYYTSDNGVTWKNASGLYATGLNYNGTIASGHGNPIQGQQAFVGTVRNYVSSSYNLTSLAGKQVRFRWVVASDNAVSGSGWYLDNVQIYPCVSLPAAPSLVSPAVDALQTNFKVPLNWSDSTPDLDHYVVQVANDSAFNSIAYQATTTVSNHTTTVSLAANKKYYWRVRAYNAANDAGAWSAARYFRTSLGRPNLLSPISGTASSLKPTFDWTDVGGATGYSLQVSDVATFATLFINVSSATSTYTATKNLVSGKTYYWRVRATGGTNSPGGWATVKSFQAP